jgi:hypothetical protein
MLQRWQDDVERFRFIPVFHREEIVILSGTLSMNTFKNYLSSVAPAVCYSRVSNSNLQIDRHIQTVQPHSPGVHTKVF